MSATNRIAADFLREQLQMDGIKSSELASVFKEEPPALDRFLYSPDYLNSLRPTIPRPDEHGYEFRLGPVQWDFLRSFEQIFLPELYIAMVEEFGEEWAPRPMKNMFAACWGKGSSDPETPIYNRKNGTWTKLRDFKAGPVAAVDSNETGNVIVSTGTDSFKEGEGRMFTVTTNSGKKMKVWEGHRFMALGRDVPTWERLWDLHVGDHIAVASTLPEPENIIELPDWEVEKVGLTVGADTKHIPEEFFSLSNRQIALLVSRLIDTDGWVSIDNTVEVGFCTASEQLADDYINLLLRLGVIASKSTKRVKYDGEVRSYFQVRVRAIHRAKKLLEQLTLLDKESARLEALAWIESSNKGRKSIHGDVEWDRIESIEYSGWGEYWTLSVDGPANYISNGGIVDHNSGKDTIVRLGFTRIASLLSHMNSPQGYFNMPSSDAIHMLNVASTAPQARRAFFDPMKTLFKNNKHLASFFYGDDPADGSNQIRLKNDICILSGNSLAESQEGLNLIAGVADEISAFKVAEEFRDPGLRQSRGAEGIVRFLRSSSASRFPQTYKVAQISFPRFEGDAILKAIAQGKTSIKEKGDRSEWFVSGPHATWEVKPGVTRADFDGHYETDPESADAMYGCRPPKTTNSFIRDEITVNSAFETVQDEPIEVEYYWGLPPSSENTAHSELQPREGWQVQFNFHEDLVPIPGALYCLHGDLAISGDRAGVAMSHVKEYRTQNEDEERPVIKNDFVFAFESDLKDRDYPREVQIRWYRQLVWELVSRGFEIDTVTFDQFQSTDMMQTLNSYGIQSGLLSLDRNDKVYQTLKDVILDGRLIGYRVEESVDTLAISELKRLRRVGRKVDHLQGQSKDASDALAGSVFNAILVGGEEDQTSNDGSFSAVDAAMYPDAGPSTPLGYREPPPVLGGTGNPFGGANPFAPSDNRY